MPHSISICPLTPQQTLDRGLLLGDGLFETLLYSDNQVMFFDQHWSRISQGAQRLQIPLDEPKENIEQVIHRLHQKNCAENTQSVIRLTLTRGTGNRGVLPPINSIPSLYIQCSPYYPPQKNTYSLTYSQVIHNEYAPLNAFKTTNYLDKIYARMQATQAGFDDAILLNTKGEVVSTTCANIFIRRGNTLLTPHLKSGPLPGIMRQHVIETEIAKGVNVIETALFPNDLENSHSTFITNSLIGTLAISHIEKWQQKPS